MRLVGAPLLHQTTREQAMAGNFGNGGTVDDDFVGGDAQGQCLADEPPGDRVQVLLIADVTLGVGDAVEDLGRVVGLGGQGQQLRSLLGIAVDGPLPRFAVDADVGNVAQPPGGDLVEVGQAAERPAIEQILLDMIEAAFALALGAGAAGAQAHG